jgi:hypothetical protein
MRKMALHSSVLPDAEWQLCVMGEMLHFLEAAKARRVVCKLTHWHGSEVVVIAKEFLLTDNGGRTPVALVERRGLGMFRPSHEEEYEQVCPLSAKSRANVM